MVDSTSTTVTLSDEDKFEIGQHFVFGFHGLEPSKEVTELIRDYKVGNIILMKRNIQSFEQVRKLVYDLQMIAKDAGHVRPLMIGIDQENGLVSAFSNPNGEAGTQFPGAMALSATKDSKVAERISRGTAKELKLAGINWTYSPVADVNSDPRNPVIGVRSFGEEPNVASKFACAVARGIHAGQVAPCAKHFPGHGDTHVDSHLALPVIKKTLDELEKTELVPFRALISANVDTIMTGHMALPSLQVPPFNKKDGDPASLSEVATAHLLRNHLGYKGVIVTDCLEMNAISDKAYGPGVERGTVLALRAGADIVMICHTYAWHVGAVKEVYAALGSGELKMADLRASGERIARMKDKFVGNKFEGDWEALTYALERDVAKDWARLKSENRRMSLHGCAAAMTWVLPQHLASVLTSITSDAGEARKIDFKALDAEKSVTIYTPAKERINPSVDDPSIEAEGGLEERKVDDEGILRTPGGVVRNTAGESYLAFGHAVVKKAGQENVLGHFVYSASDYAQTKLLLEDNVIVCLRNAHQPSSAWQLGFLNRVLENASPSKTRVIVLMTCGPYDLSGEDEVTKRVAEELKRRGEPVLCTFEFTKEALEAGADALYGSKE